MRTCSSALRTCFAPKGTCCRRIWLCDTSVLVSTLYEAFRSAGGFSPLCSLQEKLNKKTWPDRGSWGVAIYDMQMPKAPRLRKLKNRKQQRKCLKIHVLGNWKIVKSNEEVQTKRDNKKKQQRKKQWNSRKTGGGGGGKKKKKKKKKEGVCSMTINKMKMKMNRRWNIIRPRLRMEHAWAKTFLRTGDSYPNVSYQNPEPWPLCAVALLNYYLG